MVRKICLVCSEEFYRVNSRGRFCSVVCSMRHRNPIRRPIYKDGYALVPLTRGLFATIDLEDVELVCDRNWAAAEETYTYYAKSTKSNECIAMHRHILGVTDGCIQVDHIDGDGLNNRRSNLRLCDKSGNMRNRRKGSKRTSSKYKGVRISPYGTWIVQIAHRHVGCYKTEEDAARAYDAAAKQEYGEFARLNLPPAECPVVT